MNDRFGREINYLRLSVTDRCNLRCLYCHDGFFEKMPRKSILRTEEIVSLLSYLRDRGLERVKITGGEPLLRNDVTSIIKNSIQLGLDVSLTTNGVLLADKAEDLYQSGLRRVNIGLDCLNEKLFAKVTGKNRYKQVIEGINKVLSLGFKPVKINVVLIEGVNDDIRPWLEILRQKDIVVRFIEVMPFVNGYKPVRSDELISRFEQMGLILPADVEGGGPAKHYSIEGFKGKVGFISPRSNKFCDKCNRIRINAEGKIRNCLFSPTTFDYLSVARNGNVRENLDKLLDEVLVNKPKDNEGLIPEENMCQIGG